MSERRGGFTLIEILVVITIIAALMGMVVVLFGPATNQRDITITQTRIGKISAALEQLRSSQVLGMYPPADITKLTGPKGEKVGEMAGMPNDVNVGSESLFVATHMKLVNVRIEVEEDGIQNTDGDAMTGSNPTDLTKNDLFEFVDAWGNPIVYFSAREYKLWGDKGQKVQMGPDAGGEVVVVKPRVSGKLGSYVNSGSFQLISAGPDQIFGTEDDLTN